MYRVQFHLHHYTVHTVCTPRPRVPRTSPRAHTRLHRDSIPPRAFRLVHPHLLRVQNQDAIVARLHALRNDARFTEMFGITLRGRHTRRLCDGEWICDEIMDCFFGLLRQRSERRAAAGAAALPRLHVFSAHFYALLSQTGGGVYDYERVRRWTRRLASPILSLDLVLVPVHIDLVHWALAVVDCRAKCISFWDSQCGHGANCMQVRALSRQ